MEDKQNPFSDLAAAHKKWWHRLHDVSSIGLLVHGFVYSPIILAVALGSLNWCWLAWPIIGFSVSAAVKVTLNDCRMDDDMRALRFMWVGTLTATVIAVASSSLLRLAWRHFVDSWLFVITADAILYAMVFGVLFIFLAPVELFLPMPPFKVPKDK